MLREQIAATPNEAQLHLALGEALCEDQLYDEAEAALRRAIELQPALAAAHLKLSQVLKRKGTPDESVQAARLAFQYAPQSDDAILHLAELLRESQQPAEAESLYRQALELQPNSAEIHDFLGAALVEQGRPAEAIQQFDQAIQIRPDFISAHTDRAQALLAAGHFAAGWDEYQWRWQSSQQMRGNRLFTQPPWDGSSLSGRTILIHGEQGLADEILFATCYPDVIAQAAKTAIVCDARLEWLFRRSFPLAQVIGVPQGSEHSWQLPQNLLFDLHCSAGTLPKFLRRCAKRVSAQDQLLKPSPEKLNAWRDRFNQFGRQIKIGIAWRAGDALAMRSGGRTSLENWRPVLSATQCEGRQSATRRRLSPRIAEFRSRPS